MDLTKDPNTQAPDMQSATGIVPQAPMSQPSLINALQGMSGPNPLLAGASGMLNTLGGGRPGANAVLAGHAAGTEQTNKMQLAGAHMAQQAQQHQQQMLLRAQALQQRAQEHALKRDDATRTVLKDILFGANAVEDENIRRPFVEQYAKTLEGIQIAVPPSAKIAMSRGGPSQQSQKDLALLLASADVEPDPASKVFLEQHAQQEYLKRGGKPEEWPVVSRNLRNPAYLKSVNLATQDEIKLDALKLQEKERDAVYKRYPELMKGDPKVIQDMLMQHRKYNRGKPYTEGTDESQMMAYHMAKLNQATAEEAKLTRQTQIQQAMRNQSQEFQMMMQDKRFAQQQKLADQRVAKQLNSAAQQKHESALATTESFLNQFEALIPQLDEHGFLPKGDDWISSKRAAFNRTFVGPEHDVLRQWNELQSNFIGFSRGVQNDVIRAMAAQVEAARVNSSPPQKSGLEKILKNMRAQMKASQTGVPQAAPNPPASAAPAAGPLAPAKKADMRYNPATDQLEPIK